MDYLKNSTPLEEKIRQLNLASGGSSEGPNTQNTDSLRKAGPLVPPKPHKNQLKPEVPQSCCVGQTCKPLYSQRLQFTDNSSQPHGDIQEKMGSTPVIAPNVIEKQPPMLQRKKNIFGSQNAFENKASTVTLDNPAILEQQLEVLAHHKKQLEKKGLLPKQSLNNVPKLSTTSLASSGADTPTYTNLRVGVGTSSEIAEKGTQDRDCAYSNVHAQRRYFENIQKEHTNSQSKVYSNVIYEKNRSAYPQTPLTIALPTAFTCNENQEDDMQPPPSPVSSSYSELRRANDIFSVQKCDNSINEVEDSNTVNKMEVNPYSTAQNYMNVKYKGNLGNQETADYYGVGTLSQGSSTYESIYEPINPRPPSQLSSRSNFLNYSPYVNAHGQLPDSILSNSSSLNILSLGTVETSPDNISLYSSGGGNSRDLAVSSLKSESEVETLTNFLVHSMDRNDLDNYGVCFKCNERVLGENSGCTAMNQIYHIDCFTCSQCQINLQGKPFYALDGKPFCEYDYLQTLEKCSVCMKPILERILRATGKPYHPQCFTCIVCGKSLDGIPFTVDATNQNYCIEDFHKKFAPRCCVCREPIMPEPGEEETVRVVALDRSFHFECYKCEDCGLLLSSEAEGRGCYPLDDHVLCKSCNAKRVQLLTNCITTEI